MLAAFIIMVLAGLCWAQSSEEAAAKAAEQAGKYQEALDQYVAALQKAPEGSADEQRLRESAIRVAQRIKPAPAIPEEARRFFVRGQTWTKEAKSTRDFIGAAKEFANAARIAPWWGEAYYNRAVLLEKVKSYTEAVLSYKLYMLASPRAEDVSKVQQHIYALEAQQEKPRKELKETLDWIMSKIDYLEVAFTDDRFGYKQTKPYMSYKGCAVTMGWYWRAYTTKEFGGYSTNQSYRFDLKDIASAESSRSYEAYYVKLTTGKTQKISLSQKGTINEGWMNNRNVAQKDGQENYSLFSFYVSQGDMAERMVKAFQYAIELCRDIPEEPTAEKF